MLIIRQFLPKKPSSTYDEHKRDEQAAIERYERKKPTEYEEAYEFYRNGREKLRILSAKQLGPSQCVMLDFVLTAQRLERLGIFVKSVPIPEMVST